MENNQKYVRDLLYLMRQIDDRIINDVEEILRGHGRKPEEIKESIFYVVEDLFCHIIKNNPTAEG